MKISASKKFLKAYRRLGSVQQGQIDAALIKYDADRADPALRDHALNGQLNGLRAFSAGFDLRII